MWDSLTRLTNKLQVSTQHRNACANHSQDTLDEQLGAAAQEGGATDTQAAPAEVCA